MSRKRIDVTTELRKQAANGCPNAAWLLKNRRTSEERAAAVAAWLAREEQKDGRK